MTISKLLLAALCLGSVLGGAVVSGVVVSSGVECTAEAVQHQPSDAKKEFWDSEVTRGGAKGY